MIKTLTTLFVFFTAMGLAAGDVKEYPIKLVRPYRAGESFRIASQDRNLFKAAAGNGTETKNFNEEMKLRFDALMTVVAVSSKKSIEKAELKVEAFSMDAGKVKKNPVPAGKTISAAFRGAGFEYLVDGMPVDRETAQILSSIMASFGSGMDEDAVFGTKGRKRIGDCWEMNRSLAVQSIRKMDIELDPKGLSGNICLRGVQKSDRQNCLRLGIKMKADSFKTKDMKKLHIEFSTFDAEGETLYPVDEEQKPVESRMSIVMHFKGKSKESSGASEKWVDMKIHIDRKMKITSLK